MSPVKKEMFQADIPGRTTSSVAAITDIKRVEETMLVALDKRAQVGTTEKHVIVYIDSPLARCSGSVKNCVP